MTNLLEKPVIDENKYMNSMYDRIFKSIVQNPNFKKLLSLIISEVTDFSASFIYENLVFVNTELPIGNKGDRGMITDILAYVDGSIINIEANKFFKLSSIGKNNLYHHKIAYEQYKRGKDVDDTVTLQINFNMIRTFGNKLFEVFSMKNEDGTYRDEENFKRVHINMANPLEKYYTNSELSKIEKALVIFQITNKDEVWKLAKGDEDLEAMAKIIDDINKDEEIIGAYYKDEMDEWMKKIDINEAKKDGQIEGHIEGSKEKALEIARNSLEIGLDVDVISKITGLSTEDIEKMKTEGL